MSSSSLSRERAFVYAAVVLLVFYRSALFTFTQLSFNSDMAVFGLMGKHLAEGRAFPLFMYGQNYMLGLEGWMAAPLFMLFGVSVTMLKLPILMINLVVGLLLVVLLERGAGLRPRYAFLASLFFVLAPPGTIGTIQEASGGTVEPFLYLLLMWATRNRPAWFGFVSAFGVIHREFTLYGVAVILAMAVVDGAWRRRESWRALGRGLRVAAETLLIVYVLRPYSSPLGPGTTGADAGSPSQAAALLNHVCVDASTFVTGAKALVTLHWPLLFGTAHLRLDSVSIGLESAVFQGLAGSSFFFGVAAIAMALRTAAHVRFTAQWLKRNGFAVYLLTVGAMSAAAFVVARCGEAGPLRYDTLSLFGAVGLAALFFSLEPRRWLRYAGVAVISLWALLSVVGHARVWKEYVPHTPLTSKQLIVRHLDARGIKYAVSDYWIAYHVTFLTNERIIVANDDMVRIKEYQDIVAAHLGEAIRISRRPCGNTPPVIPGVYFCPVQ